jgi:2-polyprenyl-3-methyl-5-hydroxy-6-metoxy-1,4-benzoquinol methylase
MLGLKLKAEGRFFLSIHPTIRCPCGELQTTKSIEYRQRPAGETAFELGSGPYLRGYRGCNICLHLFGWHDLDLEDLYSGNYSDSTYGAEMAANYDRIMSLPPERSDNAGRVDRVNAFMTGRVVADQPRNLLDVGSGLGVFPARMWQLGWTCTIVDPDQRAVDHSIEKFKAIGVRGEFLEVCGQLEGNYDLVSFNKVLEHLEDPSEVLTPVKELLAPAGILYVEVPDGVGAAIAGPDREEFFVEHHHAFSAESLAGLLHRGGFTVLQLETLIEVSGKFTLCAFAQRSRSSNSQRS